MQKIPARILISLLRGYRYLISPLITLGFGPACRFHPSCSQYAIESLTTHGLARGGFLALKRIGRCHPWHPGGIDPVPVLKPDPTRHG